MVCDTRLKPRQTISERKAEVAKMVENLARQLASGKVKPLIGPQGAIAFTGLTEAERDGVTDACAYRRLLASGSTTALLAIQRAEMAAGRKVNMQVVGQGQHSHDGGKTWHSHRG